MLYTNHYVDNMYNEFNTIRILIIYVVAITCLRDTNLHTYVKHVTRDLYLANPFFLKRLFNAVII